MRDVVLPLGAWERQRSQTVREDVDDGRQRESYLLERRPPLPALWRSGPYAPRPAAGVTSPSRGTLSSSGLPPNVV